MKVDTKHLFTIPMYAKLKNTSPQSVRYWITTGKVKAIRIGRGSDNGRVNVLIYDENENR